jgi:hypothetical protein
MKTKRSAMKLSQIRRTIEVCLRVEMNLQNLLFTLTILMHQMRISTTEVSSVMLRSKSWKSGKKL